MKLLLLLLCIHITVGQASAQSNTNVRFERMSIEQGLSQEAVLSIYQDRTGYLWTGTQEGLNRYDGNHFRVFTHDFSKPDSLSNDWVFSIVEDAEGFLWVGTDGGGLNRFNPADHTFTHFKHQPQNSSSLNSNVVRVLFRDATNQIWVGSDNGMNRLHPKTQTFSQVNIAPSPQSALTAAMKIRAITQDSKGRLWIGTDGVGLFHWDPMTGNVSHFYHQQNNSLLSSNRIYSLMVDADDQVWVGTYDKGLTIIDHKRGSARHFNADIQSVGAIGANLIRAIYQDESGIVWIATDDGLAQWSERGQQFLMFRHSPGNPASLSSNKITAVYQDQGDVLWVGSYAGLNKWNTATRFFEHYKVTPERPSGLSNNGVNAFTQSGQDTVWIGTYGGLNALDLSNGKISHYLNDDNKNSLTENRVMSLYADDSQRVWIGTRASGFDRFDTESGQFTNYRHDPDNDNSVSANAITKIIPAQNGQLWIGTWGGGLNRFDPSSGRFSHFRHDPKDSNSISSDRILEVYQDRENKLWVGTWGGGITIFNPDMSVNRTVQLDNTPHSLSEDKIWAILEDRDRNIWIGTQGGGLNMLSAAQRESDNFRFSHFSRNNGLPSNVVYGILQDKKGFVWISTNHGICKIDPATGKITLYDNTHGLQGNEFNSGAFYQTADGRMYFGGSNGATAFDPGQIQPNKHRPPIVLSQFLRLNQRSPLSDRLAELAELTINHHDYLIALEFSALDFAEPQKNRYAYKLEGFDQDWITGQNLRRATYTNLPPGDFVFMVKAANNDGLWAADAKKIGLTVLPPPWKTLWAYLLYTLAALSVLMAIVNAYLNKLKRSREYHLELEQEVDNRTAELTELNQQLHQANITDPLSGLKNRHYLLNIIEHEIADINRKVHKAIQQGDADWTTVPRVFFLMLDLDEFKQVNELHGHDSGDHVIVEIGKILQLFFRDTDTIVRWGSDEFLAMGQVTDMREINRIAERLQQRIKSTNFAIGSDKTLRVSCSIGFSVYPFCRQTPQQFGWQQIQQIACQAIEISKSDGRDCWTGIIEGKQTLAVDQIPDIAQKTNVLVKQGVIELVEYHAFSQKPF